MAKCNRCFRSLRGTGFHTENANSMTDVAQRTLNYTHTHAHFTSSIFKAGTETRGLLLESTEAFYRTALRQGYCPHKHTLARVPSCLHTLQWVTMGRADTCCQQEGERRRGCRESRVGEVEGFEAVSCSDVHQSSPQASLWLILTASQSGGLRQACINNSIYSNGELREHCKISQVLVSFKCCMMNFALCFMVC